MATLVTKNSSTASAVPGAGDLVQGELAVNVTDKRLFTKDSGGTVVEVGTNPSSLVVAGDVGIGTSSPATTLHVQSVTGQARIQNTTSGPALIGFRNSATTDVPWVGTGGDDLRFTTLSTERARITSDGKLGIGTSSPSYRLDIVGPANTPHISSYDGNVQSVAAYPDGSGASARNYVGTLSNHDNVFLTNNVERGRFTTGGDFCVGATTVSGIGITLFNNSGPGFSLVNNNNAAATGYVFGSFRRSGTEIGSITQNGTTAVLFNTTSDRRLKDNIAPAPSASDVIDAIEIVSHDWKAAPDEHVAYGVIAQDLALVAPQAVLQGDDGKEIEKTWGVDYSKLVPLLIKEIQSLRARVAALEAV